MNIVALVGNLATDPELRHTASGKAVCTFRLAVSRQAAEQSADFFTVVVWEKQAEICSQYLRIGRRVSVEGRLHHTTWEAEEGKRRSRVEVIAHRVQMLGGPKREDSAPDLGSESGDVEAAPEVEFIPA